MKKQTKKLNVKKLLLVLLIIILIPYLYSKISLFYSNNYNSNSKLPHEDKKALYKTIKLDNNPTYPGVGQEKVNDKDGYFTTFKTLEKYKKTYIEYKQNGNSSWSTKEYWGGTMAENGCGITTLSIILSGYNKNYSPEDLRKMYFPVMDYEKLSDELYNNFGIANSGFYYDSVHLSNKKIVEHLKTNRPIIICVWNKPSNNRFTTTSHYMALLATDDNGLIYVSNPNRW